MSSAPQPNALATINTAAVPIALHVFGQERIAILKEQIGRGWKEPMTDAELEHIGLVCQRTRLDPLAKPAQIYFIKRRDTRLGRDVMTPQVSIDGLRLIAQRSREYGGQVGPMFCGPDGAWREFWLGDDPPAAAKVGVWRRGFKEPTWAVATWQEWAQWETEWVGPAGDRRPGGKKLAQFWSDKPAHMLGKTAEAMALKRAFPQETNELELAAVDQEERAQAAATVDRYKELFGSEEEGTFFDQPAAPALSAPPADALADRAEQTLDRAGPAPVGTAKPKAVREHNGRLVDTNSGEVLAEPPADHWAENRRLVATANEMRLTGVPTLPSRTGVPAVAEANRVLAERIENLKLDQQLAAEQDGAPF